VQFPPPPLPAQQFAGELTDDRVWTGAHEKTRAIKNAAAAAIPPIKVV
jgi:hypothetical protein